MKKLLKICSVLLMIIFAAGAFTPVNAQRGYRGYYGRGYSHDYARAYGGAFPGGYNPYYYHSPVFSSYYRPAFFGPRYYGIPRGSISITFGGNPYYYFGGTFYRPYGGYYRSIFPPVGIHIGILPYGYMPIYVGPDLFYFYNGTYYRRYDDRSYEVVDAPMGAQLSSLPRGAKSVVVNGEKFYELNGTYYKEDRNAKGRVVYTVVGKNGHIDNSGDEPEQAPAPAPSPAPVPAPSASPKTGDRVSELPGNCKTVIVNGERLYVSPNDTYFRPDSDGSYTIVGTAQGNTM